MSVIAELPYGSVESFDDNEVTIISEIADPPKLRLAVPDDLVEANIGAISCNTRRANGEQDEYVTFGARALSDGRWAFFVAVRYPGEQDVREVLLATSDGIYGNEPFKGSGSGIQPGDKIALRSMSNGKLVCAEGDGSQPLIANRDSVGEWETFEVVKV